VSIDAILDDHISQLKEGSAFTQQLNAGLTNMGDAARAASLEIDGLTENVRKMIASGGYEIQGGKLVNVQIAEPLHHLGRKADELGLDEFEIAELEMRKQGKWTPENHEYLEFLKEVIRRKEEEIDLAQKAKQVTEQMLTPQEQFNRAVEELNRLLEKKLITEETYQRALQKEREVLAQATEGPDMQKAKQLYEQTRTAQERLQAEKEEIRRLYEKGMIDEETYSRAMAKAIEQALNAAKGSFGEIPTLDREAQGTFNAVALWGLGSGGVVQKIADATMETAQNTKRIADNTNEGLSFS
jgi:DNA repair exonuclease SbcCD ATPase subunit